MRDRYKKTKYYPQVTERIGRNYEHLRALCYRNGVGYFGSRSYDDIFQDTVLYVCQDPESIDKHSDNDFIKHFLFRYNMIEFQTVQDAKQLKEIPYADYLQTQKTATEDR